MAWLGEPLADQTAASALTPRCRKDRVEEELFARRRDLFAELSVVFMDTTSLSFEGQGGAELGRCGHSKDHRPDLHQMIVGLVMDQDGRPLCCELWPGNTADVTTLLPVVDRLRAAVWRRPHLRRRRPGHDQCPDHRRAGATPALEYVLGVRERSSAEVRRTVIDDRRRPSSRWSCRGFRASSPSSRPSRSKSATDGTSSVAISPRRGAMPSSATPSSTGLRTTLAPKACPREGGGRQGARRQQRFPPLSQDRHRPSTSPLTRRGSPRTRASMGTTCCAPNTKLTPLPGGHAAQPRLATGRAVVPPSQGRARHAPDLPQQRHGHPRPRVLLLPGPPARQGTLENRLHRHDIAAEMGLTSGAISTDCRKSSLSRMASASCCAPRPPASPVSSSSGGRRHALPPNFQGTPPADPSSQQPKTLAPAPPLWC